MIFQILFFQYDFLRARAIQRDWLRALPSESKKIIGEDIKNNTIWLAHWYADCA